MFRRSMTIKPKTSSDNTQPEVSLKAPRIFALVVAIDRYASPTFPHLSGCKNDGERFIRFLTGVLGVPSSQIVFLADEDATEREMLKQFDEFLIQNVDIQRDEAIVFFYAGHGSRREAPPGWVTENNQIETLCSHDIYTVSGEGKEIEGISDRAINALMRKLAFEKGDNIVAVFDCCHSAGLSRAEGENLRVRCIPPPPHPPPADLNREIWSSIPDLCARSAKTVIQSGFQYKAMESHVLLAACRPDERALEDTSTSGGLFTTALLECLRRCSLHNTSYVKLFEMLDLKRKNQHPQCEGTNKDRLLFSVNTVHDGETAFKVFSRRNRLYVSAGSIHGVVVGTEFTVRSATQTSVLKAKSVRAFETTLDSGNLDITNARAIVSRWHHPTLRVHTRLCPSSTRATVVPAGEPADVALYRNHSGKWELERFDPLILAYSDRFVHFDADVKRIADILDVIANFNSYLYRSDETAASFSGKVKTRLNRIGVVETIPGPVGDDLLEVPRASHSGVEVKGATIADLDSQYCLTLENFSEVDLFPYFFYFDPSDYSVQSWYMPPSPTMLAPLKRSEGDGTPSLFALGYGGFGTDSIKFYLAPGDKTDSGFLKVFLTTTLVDMTSVVQSSISEVTSSRGLSYTLKGSWACETFVLTCRKS